MMKGWFNPELTPERLLTNYVSTGNKKYLTLLVEQFNLSLYHYLASQIGDDHAEDVLQATWLKVLKVKSTNRSHTNVKSWLFTIARNTMIDELRQLQKWQSVELSDKYIQSNSLIKDTLLVDDLKRFNRAITELPFLQREAIIFQQEGFSVLEISQLTNESFETIKSRIRYARKNLKTLLGTQR